MRWRVHRDSSGVFKVCFATCLCGRDVRRLRKMKYLLHIRFWRFVFHLCRMSCLTEGVLEGSTKAEEMSKQGSRSPCGFVKIWLTKTSETSRHGRIP